MCIAAPGKVIEINDRRATVKYPGDQVRQAFLGDAKVKVGDYVLVQMGFIIDILSKKESSSAAKIWEEK
jgi:hydrogenase expression/formation protein HypC